MKYKTKYVYCYFNIDRQTPFSNVHYAAPNKDNRFDLSVENLGTHRSRMPSRNEGRTVEQYATWTATKPPIAYESSSSEKDTTFTPIQ